MPADSLVSWGHKHCDGAIRTMAPYKCADIMLQHTNVWLHAACRQVGPSSRVSARVSPKPGKVESRMCRRCLVMMRLQPAILGGGGELMLHQGHFISTMLTHAMQRRNQSQGFGTTGWDRGMQQSPDPFSRSTTRTPIMPGLHHSAAPASTG